MSAPATTDEQDPADAGRAGLKARVARLRDVHLAEGTTLHALLYGRPQDGTDDGTRSGEKLDARPWTARHRLLLLAAVTGGFVGGLMIVASAPVWRLAPPTWRLTLPGVPHPGGSVFNGTVFVVGVIAMTLGWIALVARAGRRLGSERRRLGLVVAVFVLWAAPFVLGPPMLSNDVHSYIAQGELQSRGIDPTAHGPIYLGQGPIMKAADPVWRTNPAPYGPVAIQLSEWVVEVTGHDGGAAIWVWRALVVAGVAMTSVGMVLIARSMGVSPAVAVALGTANPLVLLHFVGGIHNDAIMAGFLALGLAAHLRGRRWLGVTLIAVATAVKLPAAAAFVYLGWTWSGVDVPFRRRVRDVAMLLGAGSGIIVALCLVVGIGPGWLLALQNTGKVTDTFSGTTRAGYVFADIVRAVGIPLSDTIAVGAFRLVGVAATAAVAVGLLLRTPRIGPVRATGLLLVAYVFLGPVMWPWYLPAGMALLAAVGVGRWRPSYFVLVFAISLTVWPTSVNAVPNLSRWQHVSSLVIVVAIACACWAVQRFVAEREMRSAPGHTGLDPAVAGRPTPVTRSRVRPC